MNAYAEPQFKKGDCVKVQIPGCSARVSAIEARVADCYYTLEGSPTWIYKGFLSLIPLTDKPAEEFAFHISGMHIDHNDHERKGNVIVCFSPDAESDVIDGALYLPFTAEASKALSLKDEYVVTIQRKEN